MAETRPPIEQLLDLFVYAPIGALLTARESMPDLIEKGRTRVTGQLAMAKMIGQFAVAQGQKEAQKVATKVAQQAGDLLTNGLSPSTPAGSPTPAGPRPGERSANGTSRNGAGPTPLVTSGAATAAASAATALGGRPATGPATEGADPSPTHVSAPGRRPGTGGQPPVGTATAPGAPAVDDLAIPGYDSLSASHVVQRLAGLSGPELDAVRAYETATRGRRTILSKIAQLQTDGTP
jgi:hypothetical protein